jgi:hypothetical protein
VVTKPTRCTSNSATLIDHVITNASHPTYETAIITSKISDHFPIVFFLQPKKPSNKPKTIISRDFSQQNLEKFNAALHNVRWGFVLEEEDPQLAYNLFSDTFFNLYDLHFPLREIRFNVNKHAVEPWMSKGLLVSRTKKFELASISAKNPSAVTISTFKNYRNLYNRILRAAKKLYYEKELTVNVNNLKRTWDLIRSATNNSSKKCKEQLSSLFVDGTLYSDPFQIACKLNEFFTTMPSKIASEIPPVNDDDVQPIDENDNIPLLSFTDSPVTGSEVLDAISELLPKKSEDFNGVSMFFIKRFKNYLFNPLRHIINRSLETGYVPQQFKIAKVIPLFKAGDRSLPDNYRPISLLSCFSKILEKVVGRRLVTFLESNGIISTSQFGFRKNHSTLHPMIHLMNFVTEALNKKETAIAIFCDLRKAFDTVNHSILLRKLHKIGIRGVALEWFKNYLSGRKQFVSLNDKCSTLLEILLGVPQGSILGPILFLLYINDLPEASLLKDFLFADDTVLLAKGKNVEELTNFVNVEFQKVVTYFRVNKLSLHPNKTKFLIFSNSPTVRNNPPQIFANYNNLSTPQNPELIIPIENVDVNSSEPAIRYLGVYFDPNLNFKHHISIIVNKLSKMMYFFKQAKHILTQKAKTMLYYSSIHSHLIYGIHIWSCTADSNLKPLILKQKMALRTLCNAAYNAHTEPLFKKCSILPLPYLCEYFKVQFMQKFTQGFLPSSFNDVWITNAVRRADQDHVELRNDADINIPFARLTSTERQPLTCFPKIWAAFPDEQIKFTRNVIEFNALLKQHYLRKLSFKPNCNRLFCPQCMPPLNLLDSSSDSSD